MIRGFWEKVGAALGNTGYNLIEKALQLYFLLQDDDVPAAAKATIASALAYFILPMDAVPDMLPGVGYGDDLAVLAAALTAVSVYLTPEVKRRAERVLRGLYSNDEEEARIRELIAANTWPRKWNGDEPRADEPFVPVLEQELGNQFLFEELDD